MVDKSLNLKSYTYIEKPFSICCLIKLFTTAYDLPLPGVPNTMDARKGIHHIDPAIVPTLFVIEACGQIDRILAFDEPRFLHETLILVVENILHQIVFQQAAHPQPAHQKTDIARADGKDIQARHRFNRQRQSQYPPVEEKQHESGGECRPYSSPSDFLALDPFRTQTGQGKQQDGQQGIRS